MKVQVQVLDEITITDNYYIIDHEIEIDALEKSIKNHWNIDRMWLALGIRCYNG